MQLLQGGAGRSDLLVQSVVDARAQLFVAASHRLNQLQPPPQLPLHALDFFQFGPLRALHIKKVHLANQALSFSVPCRSDVKHLLAPADLKQRLLHPPLTFKALV